MVALTCPRCGHAEWRYAGMLREAPGRQPVAWRCESCNWPRLIAPAVRVPGAVCDLPRKSSGCAGSPTTLRAGIAARMRPLREPAERNPSGK